MQPLLCACGCLQPMFTGDDSEVQGFLHNHHLKVGIPCYLITSTGYKTPCWIWQQGINKWGYAKVKRHGRTQGGHRLFYRAYIDPNLPRSTAGSDGLDHLCRIRKCVNPEHLEPTTCVENIRRGLVPHISRWGHSRIEDHLEEISARYSSGESQYSIAKSLGVRQSCISRILRGTRWRGLVVPTPTRSPIKLSSEQVEQIRRLCSSGETQWSVAKQFGMGQSQVSRIVRNQSWATTM